MADIFSSSDRSRIMAAIHSRDTAPEVFFRKRLFARGYRYSICPKKLPGKPDMWLRKWRVAIFVHGCFWHRHEGCKVANTPSSRQEYWLPKFRRNVERDAETKAKLKAMGIRVLVVWECSVRRMMRKRLGAEAEAEIMAKVEAFIKGGGEYLEI